MKNFIIQMAIKKMITKIHLKKHIIFPVLRIVDDIISDPLIRFIVADDMIVETGLPGETWYYFAYIDGTDTFVLINDNAQCTRFPFRVFPAGIFRELTGFFIFGVFMNWMVIGSDCWIIWFIF